MADSTLTNKATATGTYNGATNAEVLCRPPPPA